MAESMTLPEGFVLDEPLQDNGLPEGFILDQPKRSGFVEAMKGVSPAFQIGNVLRAQFAPDIAQKRKIIEDAQRQVESGYREIVSPLASGVSTAAFGVPRFMAQKAGMEEQIFPEQQTAGGKILRGGSEAAGFIKGGIGRTAFGAGIKFFPKVVGEGLTRKAFRSGVEGATAGAMLPPEDDFMNLGKRFLQSGIGAGFGAAIPFLGAGVSKIPRGVARMSGVEKETLDEIEKIGYRKVLQKKYYNKKMPEAIQARIEQNITNLESAAGDQYEALTKPLRAQSFDMAQFRGDVIKIANRVKQNPFETDVSKLDNAILDGVINKAKVGNLGSALDLRRSLDDVIYSNKGELKSTFGRQVRKLLNDELHKNKELLKVDNEWASLQEALRDGRKAIGETGEKFLSRFSTLTSKQKQMLVELEKQIKGEPFIEDLTNWSLARQFTTKKVPLTLGEAARSSLKPLARGSLRSGEALSRGARKFLGK